MIRIAQYRSDFLAVTGQNISSPHTDDSIHDLLNDLRDCRRHHRAKPLEKTS